MGTADNVNCVPNPSGSVMCFFFVLCACVHVCVFVFACVDTHMPWCIREGQGTAFRNWVFPSSGVSGLHLYSLEI